MTISNEAKLANLETASRRRPASTETDLAAVARLEFWGVLWSPTDAPVLYGEIFEDDYAEQPDGHIHYAVELVALDPGRKWARTLERTNRLGRAMGALTEDWE